MDQVYGNTQGIRRSLLERIAGLYGFPADRDEFLPGELAREAAALTALLNREISLYLSREGKVLSVTLGSADSVSLPETGRRRGEGRLSRVRCVHTHPGGVAELSQVDLAALRMYRLDAMCALGVREDGTISGLHAAFLSASPEEPRHLRLGADGLEPPAQRLLMEEIRRSGEGASVPEGEGTAPEPERAFLAGLGDEASLDELASLCGSAGALVAGRIWQDRGKSDPATYLGAGKVRELALEAQAALADLIIVDGELSPSQAARLEEATGLRILDRTALILDIFAQRAQTREGRLQVELAQLVYRAGHLVGSRSSLSRLGGGIGTRGPGETKLEVDRRVIRNRITALRRELAELETQRAIRRKNRQRSGVPVVALVGYTNTGKSSLLNRLSGSQAFVEDRLFATLDPVSRRIEVPGAEPFVLVDSVGFISRLPVQLVEAFRSTLEESMLADVLVIVSDAANPQTPAQHQTVEQVLAELSAMEQPRIEVLNKCDLVREEEIPKLPSALRVSAKTGEGCDRLLDTIVRALRSRARNITVFVPFSAYDAMGELRRMGRVLGEEHGEEGTLLEMVCDAASLGRVQSVPGIRIG